MEQIEKMKLQTLAKELFVSKSTIHRFCKKLNFEGFNELKVQVAKDLSINISTSIDVNHPFTIDDSPKVISHNIKELYEITINETFDVIDEDQLLKCAKLLNTLKVDIYTHAHNSYIADNFKEQMLTIGKHVNCPVSFYTQRLYANSSSDTHVALLLSYSGNASWIEPIVKQLYENKTPILLISKIGCNFFPQYIQHHLCISNNENLRDRISQFSSHLGFQYMMDILYACIYNLDKEKNDDYVSLSMNYTDDRSIL